MSIEPEHASPSSAVGAILLTDRQTDRQTDSWPVMMLALCQMKRIDNVTRSPLFSHVAATAAGLHSVHAYNQEQRFLTQYVIPTTVIIS